MRRYKPALSVFSVLAACAIVVLIGLLLLPAYRSAPEAARRNSCSNNLKQIIIAIRNYESEHGALPPAYTVDAEGNRLHSWRTLILPFMEESAIYETIDLSKPWDDPANSQAREAFIGVYRCPSDSLEDDKTTYLSIVGPDCAITNAILRNSSEFSDEFAKTIVVIEASPDQAVHWMSPNDIELQSDLKFDADTRTAHPGIIIAAFLDGHIKEIPLESVAERLQKMLATAEPAPASE